MNKIVYIVVAWMAVQTLHAQYDPAALARLDAMSAKYKSVPAFTANFSQQIKNEKEKVNDTFKGIITVKGEKYKLKLSDLEIYYNGSEIYSYNSDFKEVTISEFDPEEQEIAVNNIYDIYKNGFKYVVMGETEDGDTIIDLDPEDRNKSYFKIRMVINGSNELKKFTVFEKNGNQFSYTVTNFKEDNKITDEDFTFDTSKKGVEVIDLR